MTSISSVTKATLERKFIESGERDRMKELLLQRLRECGWVEEVESLCRNFMHTKGIDQVTLEDVLDNVRIRARLAVPDEVKRELVQCIRSFLQHESGINNP